MLNYASNVLNHAMFLLSMLATS